jgi:hypothetical protein
VRYLLLVALASCGHKDDPRAGLAERAKGTFHQIVIDTPPGMSDLSLDDQGNLWSVPERDRFLLELTVDGKILQKYPITGVPDGMDTESVAWLGQDHFVIGVEGGQEPTAGLLFADLKGNTLVVDQTRDLTHEVGVPLIKNHGVEGVCGRGNDLLIAIETVGKLPDGKRYAPLARLRDNVLTLSQLTLTSDVGKVSALFCTFEPDGTAHVLAIERHFGVSRFLRFDAPLAPTTITPRIALDLSAILQDSLNLEGIVQLRDGRLVSINDNQNRTVDGTTELLIFEPGIGAQ